MPGRKPKPYFLRQQSSRKGQPIKTRKLGYECTYYGHLDQGYTRCVLADRLIPGWFDPEMRSMLPREMIYPCRDHAMTHEMIDMVVNYEVDALQNLKNQFPEHSFGFEPYLPWAARRLEKANTTVKKARYRLPAEPKEASKELISRVKEGICNVEFHILRYPDGDAWGRLTIRRGKDIFTQSLVDLITDKHTVINHFPNKYKALGMDLQLVSRLTGMKDTHRRVTPASVLFRSKAV